MDHLVGALTVGSSVEARRDAEARASGYLSVRIDDLLEVLHIESESDVDAGWLYVQMVSDGQSGWLFRDGQ